MIIYYKYGNSLLFTTAKSGIIIYKNLEGEKMKKVFNFLTSTKFILVFTFLINVAIFVLFTYFIGSYVYIICSILALLILIGFINNDISSSSYKIMWVVIILTMPVFGVTLYFQLKNHRGSKRLRKYYQNIKYTSYKLLDQAPEVIDGLSKVDCGAANISKFLTNTEKWPVYTDTTSTYFKDGESYFADLFEALKSAKKYILLEYFIIESGAVWEEMFHILRMKAREGIEIKLVYDDFGCSDKFADKKFFKKLVNHGINAVPFNKPIPSISTFSQYRDHRKIVVIDGQVAYTGGINVADEYANKKQKFGYWKDTAVKVSGPAVWSFIVMFFNIWQAATKKTVDVKKYKIDYEKPSNSKVKEYVQPYATGPINKLPVAHNNFMKIITNARKYVYITTPYFVIDSEMMQALRLAALSGVDVRIIMPGKPDKKSIFYLSRSYYAELIKAGVKIYEYTPGFVHAKMVVSDDISAIVGSTNFDFRSLYLHFEAGVLLHSSKTVLNIKQDFDSVMGNSHLITLRDVKQRKWFEKFVAAFLKFFAPLM